MVHSSPPGASGVSDPRESAVRVRLDDGTEGLEVDLPGERTTIIEPMPRPGVTILIATGTHRSNSTEELERMLGRDIVSRYRVLNHDSRNPSMLARWAPRRPGFRCISIASGSTRTQHCFAPAAPAIGFIGSDGGLGKPTAGEELATDIKGTKVFTDRQNRIDFRLR